MSSQIVQTLWNYCSVLRNDGMSYGHYVGQLTVLLFLKIADEQMKPPYGEASAVPGNGEILAKGTANGADIAPATLTLSRFENSQNVKMTASGRCKPFPCSRNSGNVEMSGG